MNMQPPRAHCATTLLMCAAALGPAPIKAQSLGEQIDQQQQRLQRELEQQQRRNQPQAPTINTPAPARTTGELPDSEAPCFAIQHIQLSGDEAPNFEWALAAANDHQGQADPFAAKCIGASGINILMGRVQNAIIERGYVTTRVVAPPQDVSKGLLTLQLIPGRVAATQIDAQPPSAMRAHNALALRAGELLNVRDIDQSLENLKRVPNADAAIDIQPAANPAPGLSDLHISYQQNKAWRVNLGLDNAGSEGTGVYQSSATFSADNWLGLQELIYLSVNRSLGGEAPGPDHTQGQTLHFSVPWGYNMLELTTSRSDYAQTVAGLNTDIVYAGESTNTDLTLSRIIYRDQRAKTKLSLGAFARSSRSYIDDLEVEVQRKATGGWQLGLSHESSFDGGKWQAGVNYKRATGAFGSLSDPGEAFGETNSRFRLLSTTLGVQKDFKAWGRTWKASSAWRAQWYGTRLTNNDLFAIGGRYTVRGFDGQRSLSAEAGWLWRNEIGFDALPEALHVYAALDAGRVRGPSAETLAGRQLIGAALGVRGKYKDLHYDLSLGAPVNKPQAFRTKTPTLAFSLSYSF